MYRLCTVTGFLLGMVLAVGCAKDPGTPEEAVRRFVTLTLEGKWETASQMLDLRQKAGEMFGQVYTGGETTEQRRTQEILAERLKGSLEKENEALAKTASTFTTKMDGEAKDLATVTVDYGEARFLYKLRLDPDWQGQGKAWVIIDRSHERSGIPSSPKAGVNSVMGRLKRELGREPTLKELNEALPDAMGSIRVRGFRVGSPAPAKGTDKSAKPPETPAAQGK